MSIHSNQNYTPVLHSGITGAFLGLAETYVNHPLWVMKTRRQCGYPFTLNLRVLYRGAGAEALTMVPIDIIQMIASTALNERVFDNRNEHSFLKRYAAGFMGGAIGGIGINGIESFMLLQQKHNTGCLKTVCSLIEQKKFCLLVIGVKETMLRNGIYNTGFFSVAPKINEYMKDVIKEDNLSILASGALSGAFVSFLSHPMDTIKTKRQENEGVHSIAQTAVNIYREKGLAGFWLGVVPRSLRVVSGLTIMAWVYQKSRTQKPIAS